MEQTNFIYIDITDEDGREAKTQFSAESVKALYDEVKSQKSEIIKLRSDLSATEGRYKFQSERTSELFKEIEQANNILDALGIEKEIEKQYANSKIELAGRIALLIKELTTKA